MGTIAAFADEKAKPLTEKPSRLLAAATMCVLASACSQIPWNSDPNSAGNDETFPAAAPAVSAPVTQPASNAEVARARVTARAAVAAAAPAQARAAVPPGASPTPAVVPAPPLAEPQETKDPEPAHAIDLARPADALWGRIRGRFAIAALASPLVRVPQRC